MPNHPSHHSSARRGRRTLQSVPMLAGEAQWWAARPVPKTPARPPLPLHAAPRVSSSPTMMAVSVPLAVATPSVAAPAE